MKTKLQQTKLPTLKQLNQAETKFVIGGAANGGGTRSSSKKCKSGNKSCSAG